MKLVREDPRRGGRGFRASCDFFRAAFGTAFSEEGRIEGSWGCCLFEISALLHESEVADASTKSRTARLRGAQQRTGDKVPEVAWLGWDMEFKETSCGY